MAISDYDHCLFGPDGKSCPTFLFPGGVEIEPYKTWVYIRYGENQNISLENPGKRKVIGSVTLGSANFHGVDIEVTKLKDGQRYAAAFFCKTYKEIEPHNWEALYYGGIVCYGWRSFDQESLNAAGHTDVTEENGWSISSGSSNSGPNGEWEDFIEAYKEGAEAIRVPDIHQSEYVGVTQDLVDQFFAWEELPKEWVDKCKAQGPKRYSQGDAYFAAHGIGDSPETNIGEAKEPLLMRALTKEAE